MAAGTGGAVDSTCAGAGDGVAGASIGVSAGAGNATEAATDGAVGRSAAVCARAGHIGAFDFATTLAVRRGPEPTARADVRVRRVRDAAGVATVVLARAVRCACGCFVAAGVAAATAAVATSDTS